MRLLAILFVAALLAACGGGGSATTNSPSNGTNVIVPVHDVQGSGVGSPFTGRVVTIAAIVTGDFQDNDADDVNNLGGFYVQEATPDSDASTSDGVFVFDGNNPAIDVSVGDRVSVEGTVNENFGETQISATRVTITGSGSVQPIDITLPLAATITNSDGVQVPDYERYEGMLVRFPQALTVNDLFGLERFGEVLLSEGGRAYSYTNRNAPDVSGYNDHVLSVARRSVLLDDGRRASNVAPIRYLQAGTAPDYSIRSGDSITGITGNLRFSRGSGGSGLETYRLMPAGNPQFLSINPRPGPPAIGGNLRIASINVLNYFSTIDTGQNICGPSGNDGCRGANSTAELDRQFAKMITTLRQLNADVIGLVELENNSAESLDQIVTGLNDALGAGTYAYVNTGTIGSDAIKTGLLYRPAIVSLRGTFALLDGNVDSRFRDSFNRESLAQTFLQSSNGESLTIVINHLKSKGSDCNSVNDPDRNDGQGNCNLTRTNAALALIDWLALDPTTSGDPDFLIIGDLNAYAAEDPLTAFTDAGYINLLDTGSDFYSYGFRGEFGALDHALASPTLVDQVVESMDWHINSDEPPVLDYNLEFGRNPNLFDANLPYRTSDHDPIVIGLELTDL